MRDGTYRYILIGSGVSAVTIAKLLLEKDPSSSILMLEAGPQIAEKDRRSWWDYAALNVFDEQTLSYRRSEKLPYDWTYDQNGEYSQNGNPGWYFGDSRMVAFGGSTMHWGGWALRHKPEDFEMYSRTRLGADWPLSYADLEKYYCMAESYLSVCGDSNEDWGEPRLWRSKPFPMPPFQWTAPETEMAAGFLECGIKPGRMPVARFRKCLTTGTCKYCPIGSRFSAAQVLSDLIDDKRYSRFVLRCNSPVTQITVNSKRRVGGVEYINGASGEIARAHSDVVVLCAGTYESPKLLLLSRSSIWQNGIGNDHDLVGRYLVSHSQLKVKGERQGNQERWFQEYDFPTLMSRTYDSPKYQDGVAPKTETTS
jgi:choline dehydrogenase-like flavoprotein